MHHPLRDALTIKVGQLLNQVVVLKQDGTTGANWRGGAGVMLQAVQAVQAARVRGVEVVLRLHFTHTIAVYRLGVEKERRVG